MKKEMRLIDANAFLDEALKQYTERERGRDLLYTACEVKQNLADMICEAPTVDAVEVVHGEWEKYTDDRFMGYGADGRIRYRKVYSYKCSKCWNYTAVKHNYCPNCGAKMDGDGNG